MIAADFETTHLTGPVNLPLDKQPYIIEYTLAVLDDKTLREVARVTSLVKPPIEITDEVTSFNGITARDVADKKPFAAHFRAWCDTFLGQRVIAAHNCFFECACMEVELKRLGRLTQFPWPSERLCTVEATTHLKGRRLKQEELYELATGKKPRSAHRSDVDVDTLITNLRWLRKQRII